LRAKNERRPTLLLTSNLTVEVTGTGGEASVVLDGLVIADRPVVLSSPKADGLRTLVIRHSTLVPGRSITIDGLPKSTEPSLIAGVANTEIVIEHSIVGGLRVSSRSRTRVNDSIIDSTSAKELAYASTADILEAGGALSLRETTVIGHIFAETFDLVSNSILVAEADSRTATAPPPIRAERIQEGCVRFSYVPPTAVTPQRYRCLPDHEIATEIERREREAETVLSETEKATVRDGVVAWLIPVFTSLRYGNPGYGQLARRCPVQIRTGADDEAEMGAFHDLFQPQRETNLKIRLEEYLRFGLEAGLFYET
jgi:hypothetical protein